MRGTAVAIGECEYQPQGHGCLPDVTAETAAYWSAHALVHRSRLDELSEFGLGGGVWARNPVRAYEIAKQVRAGMVYINGGTGSS